MRAFVLRNLMVTLIYYLSNLQSLVVGDVIFAQVMGKSAAGLLLKVLCNCSDCPRVVTELGVKVRIYHLWIFLLLALVYQCIIISFAFDNKFLHGVFIRH